MNSMMLLQAHNCYYKMLNCLLPSRRGSRLQCCLLRSPRGNQDPVRLGSAALGAGGGGEVLQSFLSPRHTGQQRLDSVHASLRARTPWKAHRHAPTPTQATRGNTATQSCPEGRAVGWSALSCHLLLCPQGCPHRSRQGWWQQVPAFQRGPGVGKSVNPSAARGPRGMGQAGSILLNTHSPHTPTLHAQSLTQTHADSWHTASSPHCDSGTPHPSEAMETAYVQCIPESFLLPGASGSQAKKE